MSDCPAEWETEGASRGSPVDNFITLVIKTGDFSSCLDINVCVFPFITVSDVS